MEQSRQIEITGFLKKLKKRIQRHSVVLLEKKQRDVVTSIDRYLHLQIESFLKEHFLYPVLSEESEDKFDFCEQAGYYWIVDPLDGTVNHFRSIPISCISLALWWKQQPVLGIVLDLNRDEIFFSAVEKNAFTDQVGAWLNDRPIRVSSVKDIDHGIVAIGFPAGGNFESKSLMKSHKFFQKWHKVRLFGTAALSLCWLAAGRIDAYTEEDIYIWDVAAGLAMVKGAGGNIAVKSTKKTNVVKIKASNGKIPLGRI